MGFKRYYSIPLLFAITLIVSCDKDEPIPARLELSPFQLQVQSGQGSSTNQLTESWVSINSNFLGAFAPDATVYYLDTGIANIVISPGIRNNGILDDAIIYPMVNSYTINTHVSPGEIIQITPDTRYKPQTGFSFLCDFESGNPFTDDRDTLPSTILSLSDVDPFEGQFCGAMSVTQQSPLVEVTHEVVMNDLPTNGTSTYLEVWYKSDVSLGIGLVGIDVSGIDAFQLIYITKPTDEWNMLYLELNDWLVASGLPSYKIAFRGEYPIGGNQNAYEIFVDNIKVLHL